MGNSGFSSSRPTERGREFSSSKKQKQNTIKMALVNCMHEFVYISLRLGCPIHPGKKRERKRGLSSESVLDYRETVSTLGWVELIVKCVDESCRIQGIHRVRDAHARPIADLRLDNTAIFLKLACVPVSFRRPEYYIYIYVIDRFLFSLPLPRRGDR